MVNSFAVKEPRIHNGKWTVSCINGAGKTGQPHTKGGTWGISFLTQDLAMIFLNLTPKATKAKITKWDYIKLKTSAQQTINKMKRQPADWEKIIGNHRVDKGLIFKIQNVKNSCLSITKHQTT